MDGEEIMINLCACMGPMYGEPYCYCKMKSMGFEKQMDENPLRIAANQRDREGLEKFFEMMRNNKEKQI